MSLKWVGYIFMGVCASIIIPALTPVTAIVLIAMYLMGP